MTQMAQAYSLTLLDLACNAGAFSEVAAHLTLESLQVLIN